MCQLNFQLCLFQALFQKKQQQKKSAFLLCEEKELDSVSTINF